VTENTAAVTAKRTVPRFAERVSAAPPSRGDPPREGIARCILVSLWRFGSESASGRSEQLFNPPAIAVAERSAGRSCLHIIENK
jgi:hypothetical protein